MFIVQFNLNFEIYFSILNGAKSEKDGRIKANLLYLMYLSKKVEEAGH
jgi:hypothetical protein